MPEIRFLIVELKSTLLNGQNQTTSRGMETKTAPEIPKDAALCRYSSTN